MRGASIGDLAADFGARAEFPELPGGHFHLVIYDADQFIFNLRRPTASDISSNLRLGLRMYCSSLALSDFGDYKDQCAVHGIKYYSHCVKYYLNINKHV